MYLLPFLFKFALIRYPQQFLLAGMLKGDDADLRAGLIAAYIIGLATMRVVLKSPNFKEEDIGKISTLLGKAIQACTDIE